MKRIFALMLCLTVALGFSGCNKKSKEKKASNKSSKASLNGETNREKWENKYIGLGFEIPSSWTIASETALEASSTDTVLCDAMISSPDGSSTLDVKLESADKDKLKSFDYKKCLESTCEAIKSANIHAGFSDTKYELEQITIGKKTFESAKILVPYGQNIIYQQLIIIKCEEHIATIGLTTLSEKTLEDLINRLYTV